MCRMCGSSSMMSSLHAISPRCARPAWRNGERERRSASRLGLHGQLAAVRLDDAPGDGQAETGAAAGRVRHLHERLEDPRQVVARDSRAGVGDRNRDLVAAARRRHGDRAAGRRGAHRRCVTRLTITRSIWLAIDSDTRQIGRRIDVQADAVRLDLQSKRIHGAARGASTGAPATSCGVTAPDSIFDRSSSWRIRRSSRAASSRQTCRISCCRSSSVPAVPSSSR